jgi:hypothetical protein
MTRRTRTPPLLPRLVFGEKRIYGRDGYVTVRRRYRINERWSIESLLFMSVLCIVVWAWMTAGV